MFLFFKINVIEDDFSFFQVKGNALFHPKEAGESSTLRREEGRYHHYQLWVVLLFSLSFWMVLPFFPSLRWGCFSPLLWWVVLLGLLLLWGRGAVTPCALWAGAFFPRASITQKSGRKARPKERGGQAAPPERRQRKAVPLKGRRKDHHST